MTVVVLHERVPALVRVLLLLLAPGRELALLQSQPVLPRLLLRQSQPGSRPRASHKSVKREAQETEAREFGRKELQ